MKNNLQKGVTLMELLVGIALSAFIFVLSTQIAVGFFTLSRQDRTTQELLDTKSAVQLDIMNTARWAETIELRDDELYIDENVYVVSDGRLMKNGSFFTPETIQIQSFDPVVHTSGADLEITMQMKHTGPGSETEIVRLIVSTRSDVFTEEE